MRLEANASKSGMTGLAFLKIGVGARQTSLGSAVTTLRDDPNNMFWNPAGIYSLSHKTQIAFSYNNWLLDLQHITLAYVSKNYRAGTIGIGFNWLGFGDIPADRDVAPPGFEIYQMDERQTETYGFSDLSLQITYSYQFKSNYVFGATLKYLRETIDRQAATAFAWDFGVLYPVDWRHLTIGARLNNLGSDIRFYQINAPIPLQFAMGVSLALAEDANSSLILYSDLIKPQDYHQLYYGGLEYIFRDEISLRGGYKFGYHHQNRMDDSRDSDEGLSLGSGIYIPLGDYLLQIDYSFTRFSLFSDTHRFSFLFRF